MDSFTTYPLTFFCDTLVLWVTVKGNGMISFVKKAKLRWKINCTKQSFKVLAWLYFCSTLLFLPLLSLHQTISRWLLNNVKISKLSVFTYLLFRPSRVRPLNNVKFSMLLVFKLTTVTKTNFTSLYKTRSLLFFSNGKHNVLYIPKVSENVRTTALYILWMLCHPWRKFSYPF